MGRTGRVFLQSYRLGTCVAGERTGGRSRASGCACS